MLDSGYQSHFILDEQGNAVHEPDILKWAMWFNTANKQRIIAWNFYGGWATETDFDIHVSTVFLGSNHAFIENGPPVLWETMVFADEDILARLMEISETDDRSIILKFLEMLGGDRHVDIQKRYTSKAAAQEGHKTMCEFIETCIAKGLIEVRRPIEE